MERKGRVLAVLASGVLAAGCSGGDDGDGGAGGDDGSEPGSGTGGGDGSGTGGDDSGSGGGTGADPPPGSSGGVTVEGTVTFDFVPSVPGPDGGLDYAETEPRPVRAATVAARADGDVLAMTTTDETGGYALEVPENRTVSLRVRAELVRDGVPSWDVRVVDNTDGDALYALDGAPFDTGEADATRDLHAPSGWTGSSYGEARSAAPFAILDTVYDAMRLVLDADADTAFPPLVVHWSPDNRPARGSAAAGEIGSTHFRSGPSSPSAIYVLGAENVDTDEYDRHVIAHEWGHYFAHELSRSDSIGGPHAFGDKLDMRTAFGEGFGNAFSGMVTGESVYRDASGRDQSDGSFFFDLEGAPGLPPPENPAPGWFSEQSVHELLWDVFDAAPDAAHADTLAVGFEPIHAVMTGPQAATPAFTSVFSFLDALKARRPGDASAIDALTSVHAIEPVQDVYGTGEDNDANTSNDNILPVYRRDLAVDGGAAAGVCSTNEFASEATGAANKLGSRRFLRFDVAAEGSHTITVTTTVIPSGADFADPDFVVQRGDFERHSEGSPSATCEEAGSRPGTCVEQATFTLAPGEHVLEVYEWTNTNRSDHEEYPPIGRTCFDVEIGRAP